MKKTEPLFERPLYLLSVVKGLKAIENLETYADFLKEVSNNMLKKKQPLTSRIFLHTIQLLLESNENTKYKALQFLNEVEISNLHVHETIPLLWFIETHLDVLSNSISNEKIAFLKAKKLKSELWKRILKVSISKFLPAGDPLIPDPTIAALLDLLLGRERNRINFLTESELERIKENEVKEKRKTIKTLRIHSYIHSCLTLFLLWISLVFTLVPLTLGFLPQPLVKGIGATITTFIVFIELNLIFKLISKYRQRSFLIRRIWGWKGINKVLWSISGIIGAIFGFLYYGIV